MSMHKLPPITDTVVPILSIEYKEHTDGKPFCWNSGCSCHEDQNAISQVNQYVQEGLLTPEEATHLVSGKTV